MNLSSELSIFAAADDWPNREAVIADGQVWTFADLAERVRDLLPGLRRLEPVPTFLPVVDGSRLESMLLIYSALELGWGVIPLHGRWTEGERGAFLSRLGISDLPAPVELDRLKEVKGASLPARSTPAPGLPLAILATSGSTGSPKGVLLSRRAFLASAEANRLHLGDRDGDRTLLSLPLAHVGGLSILVRNLVARRTVVLSSNQRFAAEELLRQIEDHRITLLSLVPTMLRRLISHGRLPGPSLRAVLLGGAAASDSLIAQAEDLGWPVLPTYGLTEACSQVATRHPRDRGLAGSGVGKPLAGIEVRIRGGVLEIRGATMMDGYVPQAHGESPFQDGGWFRTGDLARIDDQGCVHILGRADNVLITGGENVSPVEVELALEEHDGVSTAAVFGRPDPEWGTAVVARVVLRPGAEGVTERELRAFLRSTLARFKIPRRIEIVPHLELTASGKIDRKALKRLVEGL